MGTKINFREIRTLKQLATDMPNSNNILIVYGLLERSVLEKISSDSLLKYPEDTCEFTVIYFLEILDESPFKLKEIRNLLEEITEDPGVEIVHCVCFDADNGEDLQFSMYSSCTCLGMVTSMHVNRLSKVCIFHTEKQKSFMKLLLAPVALNLTEFVKISSDENEIVESITSLFRFKNDEYKQIVRNELNQLSQNSVEQVPDMSQSGD